MSQVEVTEAELGCGGGGGWKSLWGDVTPTEADAHVAALQSLVPDVPALTC